MSDKELPARWEVEAWHAGEPPASWDDRFLAHPQVAAYVAELNREREAFLARQENPQDVVRRLRLREDVDSRSDKRRRFRLNVVALSGLCAVMICAIALWQFVDDDIPLTQKRSPVSGYSGSSLRLKGALSLSAVLLHRGQQRELSEEVHVVVGDLIRIAITAAREQQITVGFLEDDGTWNPLAQRYLLAAGKTYLEQTMRFTAPLQGGYIVAGSAQEMAKWRKSGAMGAGLVRLRVKPASTIESPRQ